MSTVLYWFFSIKLTYSYYYIQIIYKVNKKYIQICIQIKACSLKGLNVMEKNILYNRIKELADKQNLSIRRLEEKLGFGNGVINRWRKTNPGIDKVEAVANFFNVTTDYLLGRTDTPQFTRKDERDVQKILTDMTEGLSNDSSLAYMKNGGEEIDEEDAELLRASLENVIRQSKLIAKQKFTPKKYRKNND